jgi:hypothetical protein
MFLDGKEQRRILPVEPFENTLLCHWMMFVTD